MAKILITGGSGLVGKAISEILMNKGMQPVWLGREEGTVNGIKKFRWDLKKGYIDERAFESVEAVIHLAGAGITAKRWTNAYKKELIDSRVKSSELLFNYIAKHNYPVKTLIGASAVGYYGARQSAKVFDETDAPWTDFLSECCIQWENSYAPFTAAGMRTVILRTAVALSHKDGAYTSLRPLFKSGLGSAIASGNQYFPWIHVNDLAAMYVQALEDAGMSGVYNAVAPEMVTNEQFSRRLAKSLHRPFFMPNLPAWLLKIVLGESAVALTEGLKISSEKIQATGFGFQFGELEKALNELKGKS